VTREPRRLTRLAHVEAGSKGVGLPRGYRAKVSTWAHRLQQAASHVPAGNGQGRWLPDATVSSENELGINTLLTCIWRWAFSYSLVAPRVPRMREPAVELVLAFDALLQEHRRCGMKVPMYG